MRHFFYGFGTLLSILSIVLFLTFPRDHRLDVSFAVYWVMVIFFLIMDCRNEIIRSQRIQRNIASARNRGFGLV